MSVYVGDLSIEISEKDLTDVFAEDGSVKQVHLPLDRETGRRGFAFVEMETPVEEDRAIAELDDV